MALPVDRATGAARQRRYFPGSLSDFGLRSARVGQASSAEAKSQADLALTQLQVAAAVGNYFLLAVANQQAVTEAQANQDRWQVFNNTINIMTLGGLALAVGVLVDEGTVLLENIHVHLAQGEAKPRAVLEASREVAIPRLLAMLCVLAAFLPSFFMVGPARSLFVPLSLAVGFSMGASYLLSSSLVPVLSSWLLMAEKAHRYSSAETGFDGFRKGFYNWLDRLMAPLYFWAVTR